MNLPQWIGERTRSREQARSRRRGLGARSVSSALAVLMVGVGVAPSARAEDPVIVLKDLREPKTESPKQKLQFYVNPEVAAARQGQLYFRESPEARRKQDYLVQSYFDPSARSTEHVPGMLQFEKAVISDALELYGYDADELRRFLYTDRENAIGVLFVAFQGALAKRQRSPVEQDAVDWLRDQVQAKRVRAAEIAKAQYELWKKDPCGYSRVKPKPLAFEGSGPVCGGGKVRRPVDDGQSSFVRRLAGVRREPGALALR